MLRLDEFRYDNGRYTRFVARRDLSALIELYEANYVRLMNLAPDLETMPPGQQLRDRPSNSHANNRHRVERSAQHPADDLHRAHANDPLGRFTLVSRVSGAMNLHLTIIERHRYTTTANLSYLFHDTDPGFTPGSNSGSYLDPCNRSDADATDQQALLEPNARLCIYHDVRAVELVSHYRRRRSHYMKVMRRGRLPEVERRWQANRFLGKWLKFCLHQGHLFLAGVNSRSEYVDDMVREGRGRPAKQSTV